MDRLHDTDSAALFLHQSKNTLAYWRSMGKGPRWGKLGRRVFYRESDLLAWVDEQFAEGDAA